MTGFIAMQREALDHPLLRDGERFRAWFWLVANAAWKPTRFDIRGNITMIERGQLCVSRSQLSEAWGWSPSAVERFLARLETEQMIGRETGQGRSILTIRNYAKYQDGERETGQPTEQATGQQSDSHRTTKEQGNKGTSSRKGEGKPSPSQRARKADFPRPSWAPEGVWRDFLHNRQRKGNPNTPTAYKRFLDDIARLANDEWPPGRLLEHAAAQGWAGIYAPRENYDERRADKPSPPGRFLQRGSSTRSLAEDVAADLARSRATG